MNISTTQRPSLCTLPVELIHYIFRYLDARTIVRSFRSVCKQFYTIVKAYDQFNLDFNASLKSDFLFLCNFISPENIQSLTLSDRDETPGQVEFFLSFTRIKHFTRLRYLTLFEIDDCHLNIILKDLSTLTLQSLCIHSERDYSRDNTSLNQLSSVISLPSLRNVSLNIPDLNLSELLWPLECKIQHLEIYCRTVDEYCNILNHVPNLRKFVVIELNQDSMDETVTQLSNLTPFRQLSYLAFKHCHIDIILLESLLLLVPSIERLQLIRSIDLHTFIAHLHQWVNFVETKLLSLTQFEFFLTDDQHDFNFMVDTESLIGPFRTSFWTEKKSWFAICDYIVSPRTVILYTPLIFDPEFEYVYESKEIRRSTSVPSINNPTKMDGVRKLRLDLTNVMALATSSQGGLPHNIRFPQLDQLTIRIGDEWPLGSLRFLSSLVDLSKLIKLSLQITNSILVLGSKSILTKSFHRLLKENYYIEDNDALPNQLTSYGVYNDMSNTSGENSNSLSNNNLMEKNKTDDHHSFGLFLFSIRFCFALINMLIIVLTLITGFLYGVDLLLNMSCELVHHNQTLLISLVTNNFVNQSATFDVNRTIFNIINDCNRNIPFSKILFENASTQLQNELSSAIKDINQNIFDQFLNFNNKINITSDLHLLMSIVSSSGLTKIVILLKSIDHDFEQIRQIFHRILKRNSTLLANFTSNVFNEFEEFTMKVIQSTIEKCP
ncbi:unnamed protein product [Rotaria magnacalcarata]|uniref:F-box domain-containing protein n=1 Tax=Rotaria magnacalcarata TaxID=392030 RepID=A0A814ILQ1_9BILA|nr:unnamed protein product [Rotaria magnacalcarata]